VQLSPPLCTRVHEEVGPSHMPGFFEEGDVAGDRSVGWRVYRTGKVCLKSCIGILHPSILLVRVSDRRCKADSSGTHVYMYMYKYASTLPCKIPQLLAYYTRTVLSRTWSFTGAVLTPSFALNFPL